MRDGLEAFAEIAERQKWQVKHSGECGLALSKSWPIHLSNCFESIFLNRVGTSLLTIAPKMTAMTESGGPNHDS
jgi:hypothetical protein